MSRGLPCSGTVATHHRCALRQWQRCGRIESHSCPSMCVVLAGADEGCTDEAWGGAGRAAVQQQPLGMSRAASVTAPSEWPLTM
ncbi:hypothetical protein HaLaN_09958 [Haematococcus lacustris]|uniref:Uncharacterized protein n=1 Tax=Haematococcus lacustris TaxID=44745 RepID=A0A699YUR7_HAELA|nr:hypothetical protein HaLaN_09958 [Haematococcus lacustris]